MYYLMMTFLVETETLLLPTLDKGNEIFSFLRKNYSQLIVVAADQARNLETLSIQLCDPSNNLIDTIEFKSIFGDSDYLGLQAIVSHQLQTSDPLSESSL